ncbi:MAG: CTP synthase [Chlamydiia bacterium]
MQGRFIFITGGVLSSLGKGVIAASIASIIESMGLNASIIKLDPYLNLDPGTMSPYQHGEVYVTADGAETDLDLGHYERYTRCKISKKSNATAGQILDYVLQHERKGDYLGSTVQVIPHVTDEIKRRIHLAQEPGTDVTIIEVGGTVGDIESLPFLEAIRQMRYEHPQSCCNIHLAYVPYLKSSGESKTKPAQHSLVALRQVGIIPDLIICRSEHSIPADNLKKISLFGNVPIHAVIAQPDVDHALFEVPISLKDQKIDLLIAHILKLSPPNQANVSIWQNLLQKQINLDCKVKIGVVGKYLEHKDAYKSVFEALHHAGLSQGIKIELVEVDAEKVEIDHHIPAADGYIIMGGFGPRGFEGKIEIAKYTRTNNIPCFGICLGLQVMTIEFARNVLGIADANSTEMAPETKNPVVLSLAELKNVTQLGGTMRLGGYACALVPGSRAEGIYKKALVEERHRHRYEVNHEYLPHLTEHGLTISGIHPETELTEVIELSNHAWYLGVQFHPEFQSKAFCPHPLFISFIEHAFKHKEICFADKMVTV